MLCIEASMSSGASPSEAQIEIAEALKGFCGAPQDIEIVVSSFTSRIAFAFPYHKDSEISEIRRKLEACTSLDPKSLKIQEPTVLHH